MICTICRKTVLMADKITGACVSCKQAQPEAPVRTPRKPSKRSEYQRAYRLKNREHTAKVRNPVYIPRPQFQHVIEKDGVYKQWKNTIPQWGEKETAQIYKTRHFAEQACRIIGKGVPVML